MQLKITVSIDDCHPAKNWRILGDPTENWLRSLNEEFGAKFVLFVPSNYHREFPLSQNKSWIQELNSIPYFEIAGHGHFHQTSSPGKFGECEFAELNSWREVDNRMGLLKREWDAVEIQPSGWRNPGWLCSDTFNEWINSMQLSKKNWFKYVALHYEHNHNLQWNCKTFFGHDGIQQENISIHNGDMVMFQSHIAGSWNHNVWNESNYDQLRLSLEHLVGQYDCEFKTLKECL